MTRRRGKTGKSPARTWLAAGLVCLALWPAGAPAEEGSWHGDMSDGTDAYLDGRYAEAADHFAAALARAETFAPGDPRLLMTLSRLAAATRAEGDYAEAEPLYKRTVAIIEATVGPRHPALAQALDNYAALLEEIGRGGEAAALRARAQAIRADGAERNPEN